MKLKLLDRFSRFKDNINYKKVFKIMFLLTCVFIVLNSIENVAYAEGILDYGGENSPFNDVKSGWGQFIQDQYRNNYNLDTENLGAFDILDKAINGLANLVFFLQVIVAWLGISIFNLCFGTNITNAFSDVLTSVSNALHNGVFNKFYMVMFMVSLISILIYFMKRNYAAVFSHILVVALIVSLSVLVKSDNARTFIVETTGFSREIGESLVGSLVGSSSSSNSTEVNTNDIVGSLWSNLVHKPWMILEFDGKYDVNNESSDSEGMIQSKKILSENKNSKDREKIFEDLKIENISYIGRFASAIILFIITFIKLMILIAISVVQVFMQIMGISIVLIAPFMLLLAIVPFFGGLNLIKWLGERYLGVQITIVLLSFIIGVLLLMDTVTLTFFMSLGASFPIALMIQSVCWIMVIVFRKQLIANFNQLQRKINGSVGAGRLLANTLDKEAKLANKAKDKAIDITDKTTAPAREYVKDSTVNMKKAAENKIKYVGKYTSGNSGIQAAKFTGSTIDKVAAKFAKNDTAVSLEANNKVDDVVEKEQIYKAQVIDLDKIREARMLSDNNIKDIIQEKKSEEVGKVNLSEEKNINESNKNAVGNNRIGAINNKLESRKSTQESINLSTDKSIKSEKNKNTVDSNNRDTLNDKLESEKHTQESINLSEQKVKISGNREENKKEVKNTRRHKRENNSKIISEEKSLERNKEIKKFNSKDNVDRVEALKSKLGVSSKQIIEKERNLKNELRKISNGNKKGK